MTTADLPPSAIPLVDPGSDKCPRCDHRWHGLACRTSAGISHVNCTCPTSWEEPDQ